MGVQELVLHGVNRILEAALTSPTEEALGSVCLGVAEQITGSRYGFVGEIGEDGQLRDLALSDPRLAACRVARPNGTRRFPSDFRTRGIYGRILRDGKGFFTNDIDSHRDPVGIPKGHPPLTAFLGVPLAHDGCTAGVLAVANREGGYGVEHLEMLEALAPVVVQAYSRKRTEDALRESEKRYRDLVEFSPEPIAVQAEGRWLYANPATLTLFGAATPGELLGSPVADRVAPEARARAAALFEGLAGEQAVAPPEDRPMLRLDGSRVDVEVTGISIQYEGRPAILVVMRDMTGRKQAEEQLRGLTQRLTYHVDHSPLAVIEWGPDMRLTRWSGEAERLFGWKAEEVLGKRMEDFRWIHEEDLSRVVDVSGDLQTGADPHRFSVNRNYRKDGSVVHCEWYNSSLVDASGNLQSILSRVLDVTERDRAEEELRKARVHLEERVAERTAELEQKSLRLRELAAELTMAEYRERQRLARVLHDDVQQLLVAAKLHAGMLTDRGSDARQVAEARHVAALLDQTLVVSRTLTSDLSPPVLYAGGLGPAIQWLARGFVDKHGLEVEVAFDASGEPVDEDVRVFLFEATREILFNVVKHSGVSRARVEAGRRQDRRIEIVISDQGKGFDPRAPYSPHAAGGFGLFSIQQRLQYMGGRMEVDSSPGRGTRITLVAPLAPHSPKAPCARLGGAEEPVWTVVPASGEGRPIRVVLADDHKVVRQGLATLLGIEPDIEIVGEASDGAEAVALARSLRPHVVVMDVSMPGLNGIDATRQIVSELPGIRVIGLSMHEEGEIAAGMREAGAVAYVAKGGPSDVLIASIRKALS